MVQIAKAIGRQLNLNDSLLSELELLATLHDIGKLSVDPGILNKQSELTICEWLEIKKHPESGYRIAVSAPELAHISDYILCHHERWDGSGYPQGLRGKEIPMLSRIIAVADTYEAITHERSYRVAKTKQYAIEEIRKSSGSQFDPEVVEAFMNVIDNPNL
jgi:HD-GYP domain-containing protein (c-di-GMP phosphodiesterase class II)